MKVVQLTEAKVYPKYRIIYAQVEKIFMDADISVVEVVGILDLLKHCIIDESGENSG